tara:strand:- start:1212 stop:4598 length:3387 start_codon:yes stop_codon:yes gene_type:complete
MATLTGQPVATTFKDLLQIGNSGEGLTGTTRTVQDGDGTNSPLQLSTDAVNMNGTFQLNGVTLTASATKLNNTIVGTGDGTSLDNSIVTYDGTGGNTFQDTDVTVVGGVLTLKNATSPTINVGSTALSTGSAVIKVGNARTGDGASSIDLIGDTTNSSYGLRLIRAGGVNGSSDILHVGTGVFRITATSEIELNATTIDINGTVDISGITTINNNLIATGTATISGVSQFNSAVNIGIDGTGKDLKVFGPTSGSFMEFDETHNKLHLKYVTASSRTEPLLHLQSTRGLSAEEMIRIDGGTDAQPYISFYNPDSNSVVKEHARIMWDSYNDRMIHQIAPRVSGASGTKYIFGFSTAGNFNSFSQTFVIERDLTTIGLNSIGNRSNLRVWGDITTTTLLVTGDTSAGDNAAAGWTASEGLILTGQGSVSDLTFKNDADSVVFSIPTGSIVADFAGGIDVTGTALLSGVEFTSLTGTGSVAVTNILDEDDLASNSATALATQQSIKAYVDSGMTGQDLDFQGDSGGVLSIDLDSEVLDIAGGTGIDTVGSGNTLTASIDSTVTTLTGSQTLTNKTLTTPIISGTAVTATGAELNILDGVTSSTAELNILDGVTSTATELNILDGVTSTTAELNILDGVTSTAAELNILDGVTSTAAELNYNDTGAAVGTVVASKTVTVDVNKDVSGFREVVATGFTGTLDGVLGGGTPATATVTGLEFSSLSGTGAVSITDILDEDNMASDSATALATQQSIKAYIDSTSTAQDLDFQGDSGGVLSIDLDSEVLDIAGGTGIDTVGSGNTLTASIDSTVATLAGTQTLTNKTLTTPIISGTAVTATGAELNILDGVTSSTAELNILDGVTSTAAELNILDGVTSTTAELNILDGVTSSTAELNILDGVTSTASELNILDGVTATTDELNYNDTGAAVGTVVASKTVTVDANKDVSGFREVVATGFTGTLDGVLGGGTPATVNATIVTATGDSIFNSTGALTISKGTTAQQPTGVTGMLRYNSTTAQFEGFSGASPAWNSVGGSAIVNDTTTSTNIFPLSSSTTSGTALQVITSNAKYLYKPSDGSLQAPEMVSTNGLVVNSATVSTSYTIPSGSNAMSVGTMTVASGATVTVSSGSKWVVI